MTKNKTFNRRKKILLVFSIALFAVLFYGGIIFLGLYHKRENARISSPKFLGELIKAELAAENKKIKSGQKAKGHKFYLWYDDTEIYCSSDHFREKTNGKWLVKPTDLDKKDWDEIVSLIHQNRELESDKNSEKMKKVREKLESSANPQLFYYWDKVPGKGFLKLGERQNCYFKGWDREKKDICRLLIPENHPALIKIKFSKGQYYLIEGIENIPYCQECFGDKKIVKLTDKIVIKPC